MDLFFNPGSVAVVGASKRNINNFVVKNLLAGFAGPVYPVNPNYREIEDLPCFPSLEAIPGPVDLAIILVPAQAVPAVLQACGRKGITRVIIQSAGFAETGTEGLALQQHCLKLAAEAGIRLWGPNCMGLVDVPQKHFFTFMHPGIREEGLIPGRISLIVQSGMMSAIFLAELGRRGIGVNKACSIGNRADVDEVEVLGYLLKDPSTDVVALYLESIPRGRDFVRLAEGASKPIVVLKGGTSPAGAQAARSHTYSLSGNSRLLNSLLTQAGVILADSIFQMMEIAQALTLIPRINPACRTAILTLSGGAGILACDALERQGLPVARLSEETQQAIGQIFPPWMPVSNPIDLFPAVGLHGRGPAFDKASSAVLTDPNVDVLFIHYVAGLDDTFPDLTYLKEKADRTGKVVCFWLMGRRQGSRHFRREAQARGIPVQEDAARIAESLQAASRFQEHRDRQKENKEVRKSSRPKNKIIDLTSGEKVWDEFDSKALLSAWQVPVVAEGLVGSIREARQKARELGFPVVLKGLIPGEVHKTEKGLVRLGLADQDRLEEAFQELRTAAGEQGRLLLQKEVKGDYELIAGFIRDPQFGPCVMFGLGGIFAELNPDVAFALAPLDEPSAEDLIRAVRSQKLFKGFRGKAPLQEKALAALLVQLGHLGLAYPQIAQIDINPLIVTQGSPLAVDGTIILAQG
jgi:acyl-CoA synthetase (NDP forming)